MFYSEEIIEEIRQRNDIVDVLGSYISLKKKGNNYWACCPFHNEKTPSFSVDRDSQLYHCFGCGASGSIYTFLQNYENFTFPESIEYLAERAGVELPTRELGKEEREQMDRKAKLREINKEAAKYFYYALRQPDGKHAMEYLKKRNLSDETIHKFGLGYATMQRDDLYQYLRSKGFDDRLLADAGLIHQDKNGRPSDVFWNRVMFPIMDQNGKVIAFGGRVLGDGEPKYYNSKETDIYEKRRHLFGFYLAKKSRKKNFILCEGYMDVIAMHQAGFDQAIASLGTAFTIQQALLIKRYADRVYLAYDSDKAGVTAAKRAIPILRNAGISARMIDMRPHKDPDEFITALGKEAFEERIAQAESSIMYLVRQAGEELDLTDPEGKTAFQQRIAEILVEIEEPLERENYIEAIAETYQIDGKLLKEKVNRYGKTHAEKQKFEEIRVEQQAERRRKTEEKKDASVQPQRLLLTWYATEPDKLFPMLKEYIGPEDFTDPVCKDIATELFSQYEKEGKVNLPRIVHGYEDGQAQEAAAAILQTKLQSDAGEKSRALTEVVRKVKEESLKYQLDHLQDMGKLQEIVNRKKEVPTWQFSIEE